MDLGATISGISGLLTGKGKPVENLPPIVEGEGGENLGAYEDYEFEGGANNLNPGNLIDATQDAQQPDSLPRDPAWMMNNDQQPPSIFSKNHLKTIAAKFRGGKNDARDEAIAGLMEYVADLTQKVDATRDSVKTQLQIGKYGGKGVMAILPPKFPREPLHSIGNVYSLKLIDGMFPRNKFSGSKKDQDYGTIREFLEGMNRGQETCQLSEKDFKIALLQRCIGEAHRMVSRWITMNETVEGIYYSLYSLYANELQPNEANNMLLNYRPPRTFKLDKVEAEIDELARSASMMCRNPSDQLRMYNELGVMALRKCLPGTSSRYVEEVAARIAAAEGRPPLFNEVTEGLKNFMEAINADLKCPPPGYQLAKPRKFLALTIKGSSNNDDEQSGSYKQQRSYGSRPQKKTHFKANMITAEAGEDDLQAYVNKLRLSLAEAETHINALGSQKTYNNQGKKPFNNGYQGQKKSFQGQSQNQSGRTYHNEDNRVSKGKKYCIMCGSNTHNPHENCYSLRDDRGKQIEGGLSTGPCSICKEKMKKDLYHNSAYCPLRPKALELYKKNIITPKGVFAEYLKESGQYVVRNNNKSRGRRD